AARTDLPQSTDSSIREKQSDSGSKLELSSDLEENFFQTRQHREKFEEELSVALSYAAGIPNEQWEKVSRGESIETIQGTPLSWFLLMSASGKSSPEEDSPAPLAFRQLTEPTPKPQELHKAMEPSQRHGYVSIIQPEYITKIKLDFDRKEERFKGTVWFEAPELYAGQVDFSMFYHVGQMKVIEFDLPEFETKLIRNNELWEKQKQAGQDRVLIDLNTEIPLEDVRTAIRTFYVAKYPMFGALVEQSSKTLDTPEKLLQQETRRQIGELSIASPLTEVVNSFPGMPLVTFTEKTYLSNTELLETKVHLHHIGENSCRVVLSKKRRMTNADEEPALTAPVTAFDIRTLIQIVELTRTTTEAESDWADEQINNLIAKMMKGQMSKTEEPQKGSDQERIQGTWQVTYSEDSGRIAPQEMLKNLRFVFDQNTLTTEMGERKTVSNYTLNPQSKPKSIDITEGGRTKLGIYDLEGDTLRICFAENSEKRPTAFDSQPESANDVIIMLKRLSPRIEAIPETDEGANGSLQ
ncbi:MAG: TIGR03067 domain-containing protein, partial [Planctomycetaceae bacterium]|nr:TIGR03067 domain-containing protein [Planctomycetaceae bacterium]